MIQKCNSLKAVPDFGAAFYYHEIVTWVKIMLFRDSFILIALILLNYNKK